MDATKTKTVSLIHWRKIKISVLLKLYWRKIEPVARCCSSKYYRNSPDRNISRLLGTDLQAPFRVSSRPPPSQFIHASISLYICARAYRMYVSASDLQCFYDSYTRKFIDTEKWIEKVKRGFTTEKKTENTENKKEKQFFWSERLRYQFFF